MSEKSLLTLKERFTLYACEYLDTTLQIEVLEHDGKDVPPEMHERRYVLWDNIDFVLAQSVRVGLVDAA